jgi:hypothetical protein
MTTVPLSAIDTMRPAIDRARRILFQPFRFGLWLRFAFLAIFTGEISSSGGSPNFNWHMPAEPTTTQGATAGQFPFALPSLQRALPFIIAAALLIVVLYFVFLYISSVLRFVLFESVVTGNARIRESWRRWQAHGTSLFGWRLVFTVVVTIIDAVFIGLPLIAAWRAGVFREPGRHLFLLLAGGTLFVAVTIVLVVAALVIWVLTKDFVVPIMAAESVGPVEGWRRLLPMLKTSGGSYAGYVGFKAVLAVAAGVVVAIIAVALILMLIIPAIIIGVIAGIAVPAGHSIAWSAITIALVISFALLLFLVIMFAVSMISVPIAVFFQSYSLLFLASRYEPLFNMMFPPPPIAPPAPTPA